MADSWEYGPRPVTGVAAIWNVCLSGLVLVSSFSLAVRHDHDHGTTSHTHWLLLGWEGYESDEPPPAQHDLGISVGFVPHVSVATDATVLLAVEDIPAALRAMCRVVVMSDERSSTLIHDMSLCDSARRDRSGVLRA